MECTSRAFLTSAVGSVTVAVAIPVSSYCPIIRIAIEGVAVRMTPQVSENKKPDILKEANSKVMGW
jgi:hypothetical protein